MSTLRKKQRKTFQDLIRDDLVAGIEGILHRKVIAFLSANHIDPDYGVESFILAPAEHAEAAVEVSPVTTKAE